jgi:hypothetical protein
MSASPYSISVTAPLTPAIERVKSILFRPFDLGKWLVIGFCAWLASLGRAGGSGAWFRFGNNPRGFEFQSAFERAKEYVLANLHWIIPVAVIGGLVLLLIWLAITWVSSRGHFMFLDSVATNRAEIVEPWTRWARQGDSLFLFRVLLGIVASALLLPVLAVGMMNAGALIGGQVRLASILVRLIILGMSVLALAVVFGLVRKLTVDFVVPIMRLRGTNCWEGWREFAGLGSNHLGSFILYLLFSLVLEIAIRFMVLAVVLVTCCIAGCLIALPYLGAVVILPISIFRRSYSLYYLAQFGQEFDVFVGAARLP